MEHQSNTKHHAHTLTARGNLPKPIHLDGDMKNPEENHKDNRKNIHRNSGQTITRTLDQTSDPGATWCSLPPCSATQTQAAFKHSSTSIRKPKLAS